MRGADLPLEGITVVSLEQAVAAPFATRQLADLGARVIKVERSGVGDFARGYDETVMGMSSHFVWLNRSKESLALDLRQDEAKEILRRLVARADVFVQNLAPGAAARLGFGAEELRGEHPRLVYCSISGYGEEGPYTEKKAYGLLVQCEAGLVFITGTPETPPRSASLPVTSQQGCTPTPVCSPPSSDARGWAWARRLRSRCLRRWESGWASRRTSPGTVVRGPGAAVLRTRR